MKKKQNEFLLLLTLVAVIIIGGSGLVLASINQKPLSQFELEMRNILTQGQDDGLESIENDLKATNLDGLDQEVLGIETNSSTR